jgi:hypothetical protein
MSWFLAHWHVIAALIIGIYETLVRVIPTIGSYSLVAKIIDILKWLSDNLDKKKK